MREILRTVCVAEQSKFFTSSTTVKAPNAH